MESPTNQQAFKWPEDLEKARMRGDPEADALVAELFQRPTGPTEREMGCGAASFNFLMELMNKVFEAPELLLVNDSLLLQLLNQQPKKFVDYFDPTPAPDWVSEEKLEIANKLWRNNSLVMLATLLTGSLPACYLMKRGIPALYQSQKLLDQKYLFQRIYETGIMLDAVMDESGLKIIQDVGVSKLGKVTPTPDGPADFPRYVWGKGHMIAKKVRFLHAAMRFMLRMPRKPDGSHGEEASPYAKAEVWDEKLGAPVNQEDLAFTLLTFGVLLPRGLELVGRSVSVQEKEAFLHLWKLVGHVMGIEGWLLTDNLAEAESLYNTIKERQKGGGSEGVLLTGAVIQLLEEFLPRVFGVNKHIGILMIRLQLGKEDAELAIFGENATPEAVERVRREASDVRAKAARGEVIAKTEQLAALAKIRWIEANQNIPLRILYFFNKVSLRGAYFVSDYILRFVPLAESFTQTMLHHTSEELIKSCRDAYVRKPFDVPHSVAAWRGRPGLTDEYRLCLANWRKRVFRTLFASVALLLVVDFALAGFIVCLLFNRGPAQTIFFWSAAGCFALMSFLLSWHLPVIVAEREVMEDAAFAKAEADRVEREKQGFVDMTGETHCIVKHAKISRESS